MLLATETLLFVVKLVIEVLQIDSIHDQLFELHLIVGLYIYVFRSVSVRTVPTAISFSVERLTEILSLFEHEQVEQVENGEILYLSELYNVGVILLYCYDLLK